MSQNSKITVTKANEILKSIFAVGNTIALSTTDPNSSFTEPTASSYSRYTIKSGDFTASNSAITTSQHLLYGLAEEGWGTIVAFGVYSGSTLIYWGLLTNEVIVAEDTVPVFKVYNEEKGEGIKVTLDVVQAASVSA